MKHRILSGVGLLALAAVVMPAAIWSQTKRENKKGEPVDFRSYVERRLQKKKRKLEDICPVDSSVVAARVFKDYGAMYIADEDVVYPPKCVFSSEAEVAAFQATLETKTDKIGTRTVELQEVAMEALQNARREAAREKLSITPRGATASRRGYGDTFNIWRSRFDPALAFWTGKGKISERDAEKARKMDVIDQVSQVIDWEKESLWFSTGFNRSIFSSVAAPGTSQHLSMIALDVAEFADKRVRAILNENGWYQTVIDDQPHFTYLGVDEEDLPKRGLIPLDRGGYRYWVPNFDRETKPAVKAPTTVSSED